jgi:hypothetical protein
VGIPATAHAVNLSRFVDALGREVRLWDLAVSATIPYVFLMLLFLAHCERYERKRVKAALPAFPHAACWGVAAAWGAMLWYSVQLIESMAAPQRLSSTMGIAVFLTPFIYMPFLAVPYAAGVLAGSVYSRQIASRDDRQPAASAIKSPEH